MQTNIFGHFTVERSQLANSQTNQQREWTRMTPTGTEQYRTSYVTLTDSSCVESDVLLGPVDYITWLLLSEIGKRQSTTHPDMGCSLHPTTPVPCLRVKCWHVRLNLVSRRSSLSTGCYTGKHLNVHTHTHTQRLGG